MNRKEIFLACLFALTVTTLAVAQRKVMNLNHGWQFAKGTIDSPLSAAVKVDLPHTWNIADVADDIPGYYRGPGTYTRQLNLSAAAKFKNVYLHFKGANQLTAVYLNGQKIAEHTGGYTAFDVSLNKYLKFGNANQLAVTVNNAFNPDIAPLTADFTFFGGLYRDVELIETENTHFTEDHGAAAVYISTPEVSYASATVNVNGSVDAASASDVKIVAILSDRSGKVVAKTTVPIKAAAGRSSFALTFPKIEKPNLWSPERPYLYRVALQLTDRSGKVLDQFTSNVGFRWFKFDADKGFFLNDKSLKLIGVSRHQDLQGKGNALKRVDHLRDVMAIKAMGGNFLRVSHYPQDQAIINTCDSLGILTSVEIPVVNTITESPAFTANCQNMLLEMIRQNRNHPSVIIWAYMNEILLVPKFGNDKPRQQEYFGNVRKLATLLDSTTRAEDPSRYTMIACHGDYNRYRQVGLLDIAQLTGWNLYQGWYGGKPEDFGKFLDKFHAEYPKTPMLITEYGADADSRIRSTQSIRFDKSVDYAVDFHRIYLDAIRSRPFVSAGMVWNLADFSSEERGETTPHINSKGLLTYDRKPKDTYRFYQASLLKTPFLKISDWAARAVLPDSLNNLTATQPVTVFSNSGSVKLVVNGKSLGEKLIADGMATWEVPFRSGTNQVTATTTINGKILEDKTIVQMNLINPDINSNSLSINALLGGQRFFNDSERKEWMPSPAYQSGLFGYVEGQPYKLPNNGRLTYGTDKNILKTVNDPIYQSQLVGIKQYRFDVPDGKYELVLYFAELTHGGKSTSLAYNLDNGGQASAQSERIFDVDVNGKTVLKDYNIAQKWGALTAGRERFLLDVNSGEGITVNFNAQKGEPVLNAIQLKRIP